jgi:hypothetical protein
VSSSVALLERAKKKKKRNVQENFREKNPLEQQTNKKKPRSRPLLHAPEEFRCDNIKWIANHFQELDWCKRSVQQLKFPQCVGSARYIAIIIKRLQYIYIPFFLKKKHHHHC